jgi:N-acetylmuramoyl-L-alanine amidase
MIHARQPRALHTLFQWVGRTPHSRILAPLLFFLVVACTPRPAELVVAIDIGHSEAASGATSARGRKEFYFNQNLARLLGSELQTRGFDKSFLVNEDGAVIPLTDRTATARERNADLFISIHHDSLQPQYLSYWEFDGEQHPYSDRYRGFSIFYSQSNGEPEKSLRFALLLGKELIESGFRPTLHHAEPIEGENRELVDPQRGVYRHDDLAVLRTSQMPAVLLECGVILHRDEEILLSDPVYQRNLVLVVAGAIERALEEGLLAPG